MRPRLLIAAGLLVLTATAATFAATPATAAVDHVAGSIPTVGAPQKFVVSPDGSTLYVLSAGGGSSARIDIVDTATNAITGQIGPGPGISPSARYLAISPDGQTLYVSNDWSGVSALDVATGLTKFNTVSVGGNAEAFVPSSDGSRLYVSFNDYFPPTEVQVLDTTDGHITDRFPVPAPASSIFLSPDDSTLYLPSAGLDVFNVATHAHTATIDFGQYSGIAASPDGASIWVKLYRDNLLRIDTATATVAQSVDVDITAKQIAISPDGGTVYLTDPSYSALLVFRPADEVLERTISLGGDRDLAPMIVSGDGRTVYIGDNAGSVTVVGTTSIAPGVPTNVIATPAAGRVDLSWNAPADDGGSPVTDYIVEFASDGAFIVFADGVSTATTASVTGLEPGIQYRFRVSAVNAAGTSAASATATAVTPAATLAATGVEAGFALLAGGLLLAAGLAMKFPQTRKTFRTYLRMS